MGTPLSVIQVERFIGLLRVFGLLAGLLLIGLTNFPNRTLMVIGWATLGLLAVALPGIWVWGARTRWRAPAIVHVGFAVDVLIIAGYAVSFAHIRPNVSWSVAFTVLADATIRYGVRGAVLGYLLAVGVYALQTFSHRAVTDATTTVLGASFVLSTLFGVAGVLGLFTHVLARQTREQREQALALADALEGQERGIAAVAHEFRGALAVIVGAARTARRKGGRMDTDGLHALLEDIEGQGRHVEDLVDGLLSHHADRPGGLAVRPRQDDVAATVLRAVEASARHRRNHDLQLDLPSTVCSLDHERLHQVVRNLVDNAYRHTNHGGAVTVGIRRRGVTVEVRVTDVGDGIAPARLQQAMKPFPHGSAGALDEPVGLGLYLVHQIVAAMEGTVEIRTSQQGTSVVVRVPASRFAHDHQPAS